MLPPKLTLFVLTFLSFASLAQAGESQPSDPSIKQYNSPAKVAEIESEIKRIEDKLKSEPKAAGWILIGDAKMYLRRYSEAATAYQNAYVLSGDETTARSKLKRALYLVGAEQGVNEQ